MEKILLFLLQGIPESVGIIALSLAIAGVPLRWKLIMAAGTVYALIIFGIRSLPFTFGMHTVIGILLVTITIIKATSVPASRIFVAVFASYGSVAFLEYLIGQIFFGITKYDPQVFISDHHFLWTLLGMPQAIFLIIFALMFPKQRKPEESVWKI